MPPHRIRAVSKRVQSAKLAFDFAHNLYTRAVCFRQDYRCNSWSRLHHRLDVVGLGGQAGGDGEGDSSANDVPGILLDVHESDRSGSITLPCNAQNARGIVRW